jgi:DNA-binding transcriptional LysR family regulator
MTINFEWYKTFYFAAKTTSYTKAADSLYVTQSAVSQTIKQLEDTLQVKLFSPAGRGVQLTTEGRALYTYVEQAYNIFSAGERYIASVLSLETGQIHIGASDTISKYFLLPNLRQFNESWPNVHLAINNRHSPVLLNLARKGEIDLAVVNLDQQTRCDGLIVRKICRINNIFVAPAAWSKMLSGSLELSQLKDYPIITLQRNTTTRNVLEKYLHEHQLDLNMEFEFGSMDLIVEMTRIGMGIGFMAEVAARSAIIAGDVIRLQIQKAILQTDVAVVFSEMFQPNPAAKKIIELTTGEKFE